MKNVMKKLLVLVLSLVMLFSMTSCDIIFEILDAFIGEEYPDGPIGGEGKKEVEVLPDKNPVKDPQNPYYGLHSGYNIVPGSSDGYIWEVEDCYEIDRVFDYAIANLMEEITIDFGSLIDGYRDLSDFFKNEYLPSANKELDHITRYQYTYDGSIATFTFEYDVYTASYNLEKTPANTYLNYKNANMLIRDQLDGEATRAADFDDFAINRNNEGEMAVYNSESLWWALEHNYLPTFPAENTKAEAFYEEAKDILRRIINDDMTDYEKTLAIFEYLVDVVEYDYDSFNAIDETDANNVCYFLEGVFEYNRAVCDGKSKAFVLLCRMEGIECLRDYGDSPDGGAGHAWNYVKIDGNWYMVDTTAGDAGVHFSEGGVKAEVVDYSYFLCAVNTYKQSYGGEKAYIYSGIWDSLLKNNKNDVSIAGDYYERCDLDEKTDFVMNSDSELERLVETMFLAIEGVDGVKYTLKISLDDTVELGDVKKIMDQYSGVEYGLYDYTDDGYYLIVFDVE